MAKMAMPPIHAPQRQSTVTRALRIGAEGRKTTDQKMLHGYPAVVQTQRAARVRASIHEAIVVCQALV